jgi:hypothetical protein
MRRGTARGIGAPAAMLVALGLAGIGTLAGLVRPAPVLGCSGADPVTADALLAHPGPILVVKVIQRFGRLAEQPRSIVLGVEEELRGLSPSVIQLQRPAQAAGVCHDLFTGTIGTRMLVALGVHTQGLVLSPAWLLDDQDRLHPIYDADVPWPTLADAREALDAPGSTTSEAGLVASVLPAAQVVLAGLAVAAVVGGAAWLRRARPA